MDHLNVGTAIFSVFGLVIPLLSLTMYALGIFFLITAVRFMKRKQEQDQVLLQKLDRLIQMNSHKEN